MFLFSNSINQNHNLFIIPLTYLLKMTTRKGGARRKTRHLMTKNYRKKGKISLTKYFQAFKIGDRVVVKPEPSYQKGFCHRRYFGKNAVVSKKQGSCYELTLNINRKPKKLLMHPIHLKKVS